MKTEEQVREQFEYLKKCLMNPDVWAQAVILAWVLEENIDYGEWRSSTYENRERD